MALMLRYLGIPARVAVGFAGGTYDPKQRIWTSATAKPMRGSRFWFKGYGWLPFDPTPAAPGAAPRQTQAGVPAPGGGGAGGSGSSPAGWTLAAAGNESTLEQKLKNGQRVRPRPHHHGGSRAPAVALGGRLVTTAAGRSCFFSPPLAAAVGGIVLTKNRLSRDPERAA